LKNSENRRIILKYILKKCCRTEQTTYVTRDRELAASCEHGNELQTSMKSAELHEQPNNYKILKDCCMELGAFGCGT
jgi:hypothetical protein